MRKTRGSPKPTLPQKEKSKPNRHGTPLHTREEVEAEGFFSGKENLFLIEGDSKNPRAIQIHLAVRLHLSLPLLPIGFPFLSERIADIISIGEDFGFCLLRFLTPIGFLGGFLLEDFLPPASLLSPFPIIRDR